MLIAKREIVGLLLARLDHQRAIRADDELPQWIDVDVHGGLLEDLGLDPALLVRELGMTSRRFDRRAATDRRSPAGARR
jgi:hypothetical protein